MSANGFLTTAELDFQTYKANLKNYLKSHDTFKDYDFDGSNLSQLLDILAYNTYMNGFYLNMVGSEMFLDTAQMRQSVVSHAKELNYVPRSRSSSEATVDLYVTTTSPIVIVPKYYTFSSKVGENNLVFSTNEDITAASNGTVAVARNIKIYEGRVVTEFFVANTSQKYVISSANVDTSSVSVSVKQTSNSTDIVPFNRAYDLYGLNSNSNVFFVQGYGDGQYEILFGDGNVGNTIIDGYIVNITYRDCIGANGDKANNFTKTTLSNIIGTATDLTVSTISSSAGGSDSESVDSIKFNAPRAFSTQNRAITKNDYISLIRTNFPSIQTLSVYGGEELDEKQYGSVVITTKPYGAYVTPDNVKSQILAFLNERTPVTITPLIVDADYFYVGLNSVVNYNKTVTTLTPNGIKTKVIAAIESYNSTYLNDFGADFRYSKLVSLIDNSDPSIVSNETTVTMMKRIAPTPGIFSSFNINYGNALRSENIRYRLPKGHVPVVESTSFVYTLNGVDYNAKIQDDGIGVLYVYTTDLGDVTILADNVGSVDYNNGIVKINGIKITSYNSYINLLIRTEMPDLMINKNRLLIIDQADVNITIQSI